MNWMSLGKPSIVKQLSLFPEESKTVLTEVTVSATNQTKSQALETKFKPLIKEELKLGKLVSYVGNKKLPIFRLYRYKEAFACGLVQEFIKRFKLTPEDYLFEPFAGMGTSLFTAMQNQIPAIGIDKLPIAQFIGSTLPKICHLESGVLKNQFDCLKKKVNQARLADVALDVKIMQVAFPPDVLKQLQQWKTVIDTLESPLKDIFQLLLCSVLEPCSYTAKDGQFLRLNKEKIIPNPTELLQNKVYETEADLITFKKMWGNKFCPYPQVYLGDARNLDNLEFERTPTAIITSPPYPNRYDYTRTYALELCFYFVKNFEELKQLRFSILRSHIESKVTSQDIPPHPVVEEVVKILQNQKLNNPRIPDMLTAYFVDMQQVIQEWSNILAPNSPVAVVVDNVRFAGEMIPVDLILSDMAEKMGFTVKQIIVARYKGNSSQQMGKYGRIPVRESILVWQKG